MSKILEYASDYLQRGWLPLPIPHRSKNPNLKGWQNLILSASDLPRYFNGKPQNIGVLLGSKSNGLTDIDLDSSEAVKIADFFLPETQAGFGRVSKPRSHRLYYCDESFYEKFNNPFLLASEDEEIRKTACIAEIRGKDGLQTVFPGSTHETGEPIEWHNDGEPTRIEAKELCRAVALLASAALVSTFWRNGIRNQLTLSLCGALLRNGFNISDAKNFIRAVCAVSNDEETSDRLKAVDATAQKLKSSENVFGFPKLAELTDKKLVETICKWLEIEGRQSNHESNHQTVETETPGEFEETETKIKPFPVPSKKCFYGLAGDFVRLIEPHTEASLIALLAQFLVYFGNIVGRFAFYKVEGDRQHTNCFCVLVGKTASGRKGTSFGRVIRKQ